MSERFGLFAEAFRVKATQPPKTWDRVASVNCQMGFKAKDGTWANEWVVVKGFGDLIGVIAGIQKGDQLTVSGRMVLEQREYNGQTYKDWVILADSIQGGQSGAGRTEQPRQAQRAAPQASAQRGASSRQRKQDDDDLGPAFPSEASGMDQVPF